MEGLLNAAETGKKIESISLQKPLISIVEPGSQNPSSSEGDGIRSISLKSGSTLVTDTTRKDLDGQPFLQQAYLKDSSLTSLPSDAHVLLNAEPSHDVLVSIVKYLESGIKKQHGFDVRAQGVTASAITDTLITVIIPAQWDYLQGGRLSREDLELRQNLLSCITSYSGLSRLLIQIKQVSSDPKGNDSAVAPIMLSVLENLLTGTRVVSALLAYSLVTSDKPMKRLPYWQELMSLLAGSKILSVVAEYIGKLQIYEEQTPLETWLWLGNGQEYCEWLATNIATTAMELNLENTEAWGMLGKLTQRGFSLGSRDSFVLGMFSHFMLGTEPALTALRDLLRSLLPAQQKMFFDSMLKYVAQKYLNNKNDLLVSSQNKLPNNAIAAVAEMIEGIVEDNDPLKSYTRQCIMDANNTNFLMALSARRAVVMTFYLEEETVYETLEKCLKSFSDNMSIQYMSLPQQEALTQNLLLLFGQLYRLNPDRVKVISRSSSYLPAVSNRLRASLPRARYLGMVLGVAISRLVDEPQSVMNFDVDEMRTEDTKEWLRLVNVPEEVRSTDALKALLHTSRDNENPKRGRKSPVSKPSRVQVAKSKVSKIISIQEIEDNSSADNELVAYQKPDEDASDSEEDPTLVDRSKPRTPVYITDLIKLLEVNDKPDIVQLALENASSLIRRKTSFGTEFSDNAEKLVAALLNVNEGVSKKATQNLRLEAMIACVTALPTKVAPYLSKTYFEDDYSLVQRASLLSAIGLAARELAGYDIDPGSTLSRETFPSKRLPNHLSNIYLAVDSVAEKLTQTTMQPMALAAADNITGPNILKVKTFSSRLDVEKKFKEKSKARSIRIPKDLHKVLIESLYLPLCRRMVSLLSVYLQSSRSPIFEQHIFRLFLQTLTVIITTLGPHAVQLSAITGETLQLLTGLHNKANLSLNPVILPPVLQLLLTTLDLNIEAGTVAEERLVTDFGSSISELMAWVAILQDSQVPIDHKSGMPWTVLAAGCQVKWQEVGKKFQGRMMGLTGTEMDSF